MTTKNYTSKLSGQIGENLVVAELGRRGIIATAFAGNVPEIDLLAYKNGKSTPLQVKALRAGSVSISDARKYLDIDFDGDIQKVLGKRSDVDLELIFIIVKIGQRLGDDIFYICKQKTIQDLIFKRYSTNMKKHNGRRPRNPDSFHCKIELGDLENYRDKWELIDDVFDNMII